MAFGAKSIKGVASFVGLEDTPASYLGQSDKLTKVKATEDGVKFGLPTLYFFASGGTGVNYTGTVDSGLYWTDGLGGTVSAVYTFPVRTNIPWGLFSSLGYTKLEAKLIGFMQNGTAGETIYAFLYYQKDDATLVKLTGTEIALTSTTWTKVESGWADVWGVVGFTEDIAHFYTGGRVSAGTGKFHGGTAIFRLT